MNFKKKKKKIYFLANLLLKLFFCFLIELFTSDLVGFWIILSGNSIFHTEDDIGRCENAAL